MDVKNRIPIDDATGLPSVPVGYFWRVTGVDNHRYRANFYITLRRKFLWWSLEVEKAMGSFATVYGPTLQHSIRARACSVYADVFGTDALDLSGVAGDYPPKELVTK